MLDQQLGTPVAINQSPYLSAEFRYQIMWLHYTFDIGEYLLFISVFVVVIPIEGLTIVDTMHCHSTMQFIGGIE